MNQFAFEMVGDRLFITSQQGTHMELGTDALFELLEYLVQENVIAGVVRLLERLPDGTLLYRVGFSNPDDPAKPLVRDMSVFERTIEMDWDAAEDRRGAD